VEGSIGVVGPFEDLWEEKRGQMREERRIGGGVDSPRSEGGASLASFRRRRWSCTCIKESQKRKEVSKLIERCEPRKEREGKGKKSRGGRDASSLHLPTVPSSSLAPTRRFKGKYT